MENNIKHCLDGNGDIISLLFGCIIGILPFIAVWVTEKQHEGEYDDF